ncbi:MAG: ferritin-like domain-containing protein [Hyphomicrobiales bacterium]|nr:MAG: ferritin-like domain-containing protein [Hyphomicrobiales bacterium]
MTNNNILTGIDPEIIERLVADDRQLLRSSALKLGALASAPLVLAMASQEAFGQDMPAEVTDVLLFALTLEHIEDAFYRSGLSAKGLIPEKFVGIFNQIGKHEAAHVALLSGALGAKAIERPKLDLTAGGKYGDALTNFDTYLTLSQTFEDLGVAAYKGQAGNLISSDDLLTVALQIHSVEARHAAIVRKIGGKKSWDGAFDDPMTKEDVLAAAKPFLA